MRPFWRTLDVSRMEGAGWPGDRSGGEVSILIASAFPGSRCSDGTEVPHRLVALSGAQQHRREVKAKRHVVRHRGHRVTQAVQ